MINPQFNLLLSCNRLNWHLTCTNQCLIIILSLLHALLGICKFSISYHFKFIESPFLPQQPRGHQFSKVHLLFTLEYGVKKSLGPKLPLTPHTEQLCREQDQTQGVFFIRAMVTLLLMAPKYSQQVYQNRLEGVCDLQCQGLSFCAFEKTWEIRNRNTTISFSHLNLFQSFLNSFVLSLNRKRKKGRISLFLCPVHSVSITVFLSPSPGVGTATFWDAERENQVCHFSCTYPLLLDTKNSSSEREEK